MFLFFSFFPLENKLIRKKIEVIGKKGWGSMVYFPLLRGSIKAVIGCHDISQDRIFILSCVWQFSRIG